MNISRFILAVLACLIAGSAFATLALVGLGLRRWSAAPRAGA